MKPVPAPDSPDSPHVGPGAITVPDPRLRTVVLVRWGMVLWVVALAVLVAVPSLRADGRGWWLWVPVAGVVLGAVGHVYLVRGRGHARSA